MNKLLQEIKDYLREVLGIVEGSRYWDQPWSDAKQLPFYLQNLYTFDRFEMLGNSCLLMISRTENGETPAIVRKHLDAVNNHFSGDVIYIIKGINSYNRKRLIEQRVPFIVPGNQLYLPMLGIDLREHFKQNKKPKKKWLTAAAQVLVIREILGLDLHALSVKEFAELLGYSSMTLTRAIKELVDQELASAEMIGREKRLDFNYKGYELWQKAASYLHNPVRKSVWVVKQNLEQLINHADAKRAGGSALAEYTMLGDLKNQVIAVNAREWPGMKKLMNIEERDERDVDSVQLELWRYSPGATTADAVVDPLSLWLSIENKHDERIEMAREELLEKVWSKRQW